METSEIEAAAQHLGLTGRDEGYGSVVLVAPNGNEVRISECVAQYGYADGLAIEVGNPLVPCWQCSGRGQVTLYFKHSPPVTRPCDIPLCLRRRGINVP